MLNDYYRKKQGDKYAYKDSYDEHYNLEEPSWVAIGLTALGAIICLGFVYIFR